MKFLIESDIIDKKIPKRLLKGEKAYENCRSMRSRRIESEKSVASCDYPDFALKAADAVASGECERGIVICSSGIGVSIVANKVPGIRCAHCHDTYCAKYTRYHNDANMLAFGERVIGAGLMEEIVTEFLTCEYMGGERHDRRIAKIKAIEEKYCKKEYIK